MASLDSADKAMYHSVNRPHELVPFSRFLEGMIEFRRSFRGSFWLQVTLLDGINAIEAEVMKIAKLVDFLNPDQTFIRTVSGNPVEDFVHPVEHSRLQKFARFSVQDRWLSITRRSLCKARRHTTVCLLECMIDKNPFPSFI
jgi:GTP-binding protein